MVSGTRTLAANPFGCCEFHFMVLVLMLMHFHVLSKMSRKKLDLNNSIYVVPVSSNHFSAPHDSHTSDINHKLEQISELLCLKDSTDKILLGKSRKNKF